MKKIIVLVIATLVMTSMCAQNPDINQDSLRQVLLSIDSKSINDNEDKNFTIRKQSSTIEIFVSGKREAVLPILLYSCIDFLKFDSIRTELKRISSKESDLVVRCFLSKSGIEEQKALIKLLEFDKQSKNNRN